MSTVLADPAEMIANGAPRVIQNDAELEVYTDALFRLTALESPSNSEVKAIEPDLAGGALRARALLSAQG